MISGRGMIAGSAGSCSVWYPAPADAAPGFYKDAVRSTWVPLRMDGGVRELVRYATLAAQPQPAALEVRHRGACVHDCAGL